jgi:RNA polymerase sigma-70 factor (ECF subfamily)
MMDVLALTASPTRLAAEVRLRAAIDAHYDVVWRFLRRMGVAEAAVEDAAQQVLLVFTQRLDRVDVASERSFLLGTALRVAADFRKRTARQRDVADEGAFGEIAADAPDPDDALDERRARRLLDCVLERMPEDLRSVFVMCDVEELTMAEVAATIGIPAGTVASRLRRARAAFHELLGAAQRERGGKRQGGSHG